MERTREAQRLLIQLVEERPVLWQKDLPNFRDKSAKDKAWSEVCRILDKDYDEKTKSDKYEATLQIAKKWYNIRDAYVKSLKHSKAKPYVFADDLQFLGLSESNRPTKKRRFESNSEEEFFWNEDNTEPEAEGQFVNIEDYNVSHSKSEILNVVRNSATEEVFNVLANYIEREEDEDRAFFKSITSAVKSLPENAKFEFRMEVMKLIDNLKLKYDPGQKRTFKKEALDDDFDYSDNDLEC